MGSAAAEGALEAVVPREAGKMTNTAQKFLTDQEQQRITTAVQEAEKTTSGEIIPMIVSRSHDYPVAAIRGSLLFSIPPALLLPVLGSHLFWMDPYNVWYFLSCFVPLFLLTHFVMGKIPKLHSRFVTGKEAETEVHEEAVKSFYFEKLYKTEKENGVLLFISLFEKRAVILADYGAHRLIPQEEWEKIVTKLTKGIRNDNSCTSICEAISEIGTLLHNHFPSEKKQDELHNLIIR